MSTGPSLPLTGQRVLIFQQRVWARQIGHGLAKRLHAGGAELAAITLKRSTDSFVRIQQEVPYRFIISHDSIMADPGSFLGTTRHSLDNVCAGLGIDTVWPLVQSLRNFVFSYREAYYYGFKQNVPDEQIVLYLQAAYEMCRRVFDEFNPQAIIAPNFVALPHIFMNLYARRRGVPMIGVTDTKVRGILCFTHSYLDDAGPLFDRFRELEAGAVSKNEGNAIRYIESNKQTLMNTSQMEVARKPVSTYRQLRGLAREIRASFDRENYIPVLGPTLDARTPRMVLRDFLRRREFERASSSRSYYRLEDIGRFAFFPLQFQPEATIDVISPRFNNQIETVRQVAMSLPGDMTLVVKDHPAMLGYRSPSYLEKVARTPNVKLIDYRVPTDAILRKADILIGSSGTVFAEAAMLRLPAIQLGGLGTTLMLPNVVHHTDLSTLTDRISEALKMDLNTPEYDRKLANFVAAAYDVGFDHNYFGIWDRGETGDAEAIYRRYVGELRRCFATNSANATTSN